MAQFGLRSRFAAAVSQARRIEKLVALALLFVLLATAMLGIISVLKGPDWSSLWKSLLLGLLLGWALALWRLPPGRVALIAGVLGLGYALLVPSGLGGKLMPPLAELVQAAWQVGTSLRITGLDLSPLVDPLSEISALAGVVVDRVRIWVTDLAIGQPAFDPVAAAMVWSALAWFTAAWAGWAVEARKNALLAALPAILLSVGTLSYGRRMSPALYLMLGFMLLLLATVQHDRREQAWDDSGVAYPKHKGRQIGSAAILTAAVLVSLSALLPSLSVERIKEWVDAHRKPTAQQDSGLAESLGIISGRTGVPDAFEAVRRPGLPQSHLIGSGPELSQRMVMTVSIPDAQAVSGADVPPALYWRSFTYDNYTGHGWLSGQTQQDVYAPNETLQAGRGRSRILVRQEVRPVQDTAGVVYADGELVRVNKQSRAAWRSFGDLFGVQLEATGIVPYTAYSLVPVADERALQAAGQKYPEWIRQRYLALPQEVPDRVRSLAITLTATKPTAYDRALAIEGYLRTFPYSLDVPYPPSNQDVVDYFLFDLQEGYCDYYASSMVVLARAAGVPARLVTGYASGTYNLNSKRYVVTEADAHSWVEIYFPDIGWIPFEPTAGRPLVVRTRRTASERNPEPAFPPQATGTIPLEHMPWVWQVPLAGLALLVLMGAVWTLLDEVRLYRLSEQAVAVEIYRRLKRHAAFVGVACGRGDTIYEFAASLNAYLDKLAGKRIEDGLARRTTREVRSIADEIVRLNYRWTAARYNRSSTVLRQWRTLRWRLRLVWVRMRWGALYERLVTILTGSAPGSSIVIRKESQS